MSMSVALPMVRQIQDLCTKKYKQGKIEKNVFVLGFYESIDRLKE